MSPDDSEASGEEGEARWGQPWAAGAAVVINSGLV